MYESKRKPPRQPQCNASAAGELVPMTGSGAGTLPSIAATGGSTPSIVPCITVGWAVLFDEVEVPIASVMVQGTL